MRIIAKINIKDNCSEEIIMRIIKIIRILSLNMINGMIDVNRNKWNNENNWNH